MKKTLFTCPNCDKQYDTKEKAEQCLEQDLKCVCEKQFNAYWGYGVYLVFSTGEIRRDVVHSNPDYDNPQYAQMTRITHCPYCGRRLVEDDKEVLLRLCGSCSKAKFENGKIYCEKRAKSSFPTKIDLVRETCSIKEKRGKTK